MKKFMNLILQFVAVSLCLVFINYLIGEFVGPKKVIYLNTVDHDSYPKYEKTYYKYSNDLNEEGNLLDIYTKDGLWKKYYETGELNWTTNWDNGLENGPSVIYYRSGKIKGESNYRSGNKEGLSKSYYENGQLKWVFNNKKGKRVGVMKFYYETGQLKSEWDYKEGSTDGSRWGLTPQSTKCWNKDGDEIECDDHDPFGRFYSFGEKNDSTGLNDFFND